LRVWVLSDLHLEVEPLHYSLKIPNANLCVMAGDLHRPAAAGVQWLSEHILPHMPVVYVPGNHEFYGNSIKEGLSEGRQAAAADHLNLHLLSDACAVIEGVRFVGATLWTYYELMGNGSTAALAMHYAKERMNDYRMIAMSKTPWRRFSPEDALHLHMQSRTFLEETLSEPFDGPTVVVSHHCPHPNSIHERFRGDLLNAAFTSDLTDLICQGKPDLWIHGHTHDSFDYRVGETRIVCNPRGYGKENLRFVPELVIELPLAGG